jgi:signal transduction histidine kinase
MLMPTKTIQFPTKIDLDQFISMQAHDLRTPFNHIIGFSKMTLNTVGDAPLTSYQKEDLATVYRSGLRALGLMNGLIDIARINRHEKELKPTDIHLQAVMDACLPQWKKFNPAIEADLQTQILTQSSTIHADEPLLKQIITGFMTYVAQYCDPKQTIRVMIEEEPNAFAFTFTSSGTRARLPSVLDLEMLGFVNQTFVELHSGKIITAEENDEGAMVRIALPKE